MDIFQKRTQQNLVLIDSVNLPEYVKINCANSVALKSLSSVHGARKGIAQTIDRNESKKEMISHLNSSTDQIIPCGTYGRSTIKK